MMEAQTDISVLRPPVNLRNINTGNVFYTPLTSFAGMYIFIKVIFHYFKFYINI